MKNTAQDIRSGSCLELVLTPAAGGAEIQEEPASEPGTAMVQLKWKRWFLFARNYGVKAKGFHAEPGSGKP